MRTMTKEYTVYNYQDIINNEDLKQTILNKHYDINVDYYDWSRYLLDDWTNSLEKIGFINSKIEYTGFYSQGDGASFTCDYIDIPVYVDNSVEFTSREKKILTALYEQNFIESKVERINHHYHHENSVTVYIYDGHMPASWTRIQKIVDKLAKILKNEVIDKSCEIYTDLRKEYEYLTSESAILETIEANGYEFYEDGSIV